MRIAHKVKREVQKTYYHLATPEELSWMVDFGILATLVVVSSFSYFFVITFTDKKADPQIIIAIVAAMGNVLQYYFGSSQGANKKDEIIAANIASSEGK